MVDLEGALSHWWDRDSVRSLEMHLKKKYLEKTGKKCTCYDAIPSEGAGAFLENRHLQRENWWGGSIMYLSIGVAVTAIAAFYANSFVRK